MAVNRKRLLLPNTMARAGWQIAEGRDDVEAIPYAPSMPTPEFHAALKDIDGVSLALTPYGQPELDASPRMQVVARIGVGFDTVDVPALTAKKIPLMTVGIANSVSVAEQAFSLLFHLAKQNAQHDAFVRGGTWREQMTAFPLDFFEKTVLVVGFGRIGTRFAKRALAFEMRVLVYDPYVPAETIRAAGGEPVSDLDAAVAQADFITVHCPKNSETINLFDATRLARMKPAAYIVNTARGGIVNEKALAEILSAGKIAGAGIDVFEKEPAPIDHPLLKLTNCVVAPHMAGVTKESMDRMAVAAVENILSVLDGRPIKENAVNPEVFE
ncbi:MAG TPA: hydroxyacid dehydrogenase [Xanthobacteraceae bacterium]|nr:hydroxyacid dehydrogenase [Xanthobacteraceae bacterium]